MRSTSRYAAATAAALLVLGPSAPAARAELPLPDATFYGQIKTKDGSPVTSGVLSAAVKRGAAAVLSAAGEFKSADGATWYVVKIPMETTIGAPGPSGNAHDGDALDALTLNGTKLDPASAPPAIKAGSVTRIDFTSSTAGTPAFRRGDCNDDTLIDISDAVAILNFLFVNPAVPHCLDSCDMDGSKVLEITDGVFLLSFMFLGGGAPPAPFPDCGAAAGPSPLGCQDSICLH